MTYLASAVALVGAIGLLNLVLILGIIRRLREHTALLSRSSGGGADGVLAAGETVADFAVRTASGELLSRDRIGRDAVVAFFSPNCRPCRERMPEFAAYAKGLAGGDTPVVAAVTGDESEGAELIAGLRPVADVVVGEEAVRLATAFGVQGYPSFYLMEENGRVAASGHGLSVYGTLAPA